VLTSASLNFFSSACFFFSSFNCGQQARQQGPTCGEGEMVGWLVGSRLLTLLLLGRAASNHPLPLFQFHCVFPSK
jgi:hypothetical protein